MDPSEVQVEQLSILSVHKNIPVELIKYEEFKIHPKETFNSYPNEQLIHEVELIHDKQLSPHDKHILAFKNCWNCPQVIDGQVE